ncbi:MAG: hemolysin family protein [Bacilli bacterium]|nr:hemolysin family protein [Bacilli bacterium]
MYIFILIILIGISALCSMTETALSSVSIIRIKAKARKGDKKSIKVYRLVKKYSETVTTILIFNNIVNILSTSLATYIFSKSLGSSGVAYATIIMTIVILMFGEITPKIFGKNNALDIMYKVTPIFTVLVNIMFPITKLVQKFENKFNKNEKKITATEDELLEIVQTIEYEGVLNQGESELIQNAVSFDDKRVSSVMLKKEDVIFLYDDASEQTIRDIISSQKYSRIPVICRNTNKVIGIVHEGDLIDDILNNKKISIQSLIKDVIYITPGRKLSYALDKIQKSRMHMAIVVDNSEDHNFLGIVTLEDIIEELVGEIYDEYDDLPQNVVEIGLHTFQINPNIEVKYFFNNYLENMEVPNIKSKTFVGWLKELDSNRIKKNAEFQYKNIKMKILSIDAGNPTKIELTFTTNYVYDI